MRETKPKIWLYALLFIAITLALFFVLSTVAFSVAMSPYFFGSSEAIFGTIFTVVTCILLPLATLFASIYIIAILFLKRHHRLMTNRELLKTVLPSAILIFIYLSLYLLVMGLSAQPPDAIYIGLLIVGGLIGVFLIGLLIVWFFNWLIKKLLSAKLARYE